MAMVSTVTSVRPSVGDVDVRCREGSYPGSRHASRSAPAHDGRHHMVLRIGAAAGTFQRIYWVVEHCRCV